jgi:hypothetical protein
MEGRELRRVLDAHQLIARAYKDDPVRVRVTNPDGGTGRPEW